MAKLQGKTSIITGAKYLGLCSAFLIVGCTSAQQRPPALTDTRAADEAAIRKADADWVKAAQSKQVEAWVAFYSGDAVVLPPNDKVATSKDSIRKAVGELLALPGLSLTWQPAKVDRFRS